MRSFPTAREMWTLLYEHHAASKVDDKPCVSIGPSCEINVYTPAKAQSPNLTVFDNEKNRFMLEIKREFRRDGNFHYRWVVRPTRETVTKLALYSKR
jgi:hypothetical protein